MKYSDLCQAVVLSPEFDADLATWFVKQAKDGMRFFLAHADDGVIWGRVEGERLTFAGDSHPETPETKVKLRKETLQRARLFGPSGELYVWRVDSGFRGRLIADGESVSDDCIPDCYWLWGTLGDKGREADGFTLLVEGKQGLRHAPPITGLSKEQRAMLTVRHYVEYDAHDQAYIVGSRLTGLTKVEVNKSPERSVS